MKVSQKFRNILAGCILAAMGSLFIGHFVKFPDSPITLRQDNSYRGKQGQPRTREDFESYNQWSLALNLTWPTGMLAIFLLRGSAIKLRKNTL